MKITSKTGDGGYTGLPAGVRVSKDDPRIECLGAVDELDAFLAAALLAGISPRCAETLAAVRDELFAVIMPAIAGIPSRPADTARLEERIAEIEARIHRDNGFVRAWTRPAPAALNVARTICRRAEREAVTLSRSGTDGGAGRDGENGVTAYLNRLSDLLFLLALNEETARPDNANG
ncbi:MAG: ATP:cob(I)alamin adenosyltransferase [Treponema sp.]|jgi:cob(I)alamin adenosyltransferase|nr:ATP:cob(I)alamin adenosyltransferase [Treponema sp.]